MKILHISSPLSWRGGEQQIQYMIDHQMKNYQVFLFSPKNSVLSKKNDTIHCFHFQDGVINSFFTARQLARLQSENRFDIIHAHDSKAHTILWMAYLLYGLNVPSIVHRRVDFNPNLSSKLKYNSSKISKIICVSEQVKKTLSSHLKNKEKLTLVYSGVDLSIPKSASIRKDLGVPEDKFTIAMMAALTSEKRHDIFLAVANRLLDKHDKLHFIIIGEGVLKSDIEQYIEKNGMKEQVTLTGQIEDAKSKLLDIDLLMHTAEKEGLGTSLIEALNSNIPVIANRTGGIPEIIQPNENGVLIDNNQVESYVKEIDHLLKYSKEYEKLRGNAKLSVKKFDVDVMNGKIIDIYHQLLKQQ